VITLKQDGVELTCGSPPMHLHVIWQKGAKVRRVCVSTRWPFAKSARKVVLSVVEPWSATEVAAILFYRCVFHAVRARVALFPWARKCSVSLPPHLNAPAL
jgi:hypothetical protein